MEKYSQLDQDKRTVLLSLLSQDTAADPSAWQLFWQEVLGDDSGAGGEDLETLVSVFDEGISQITAANLEAKAVISQWVKEVIRIAELRGSDQANFSERLLTFDTREKILTASLEVFSAKGFHGTTVDEIAERAELGKGTVYRHFHSKKGLFSELIRSKVAELEQAVAGAIDPRADVLEFIEAYLRIYFAFFDRNRNLYKVLIQEQSDFGAEVKALYIGNILKKVPLLKRKILQATKSGLLKQMDFHTVFYGVMGFIDGIMQKWLASDGEYSLVDDLPTVIETVFYGFVNPELPGEAAGNQPR
jgi:AcrR family transcriptional regulator